MPNFASMTNSLNKISGFLGANTLRGMAGYGANYASGLMRGQGSLIGPKMIGGMAKNWITANGMTGGARMGAIAARAGLAGGAAALAGYGAYKAGETAYNHPFMTAGLATGGAAYAFRNQINRIPGANALGVKAMSAAKGISSSIRSGISRFSPKGPLGI